MDLSTFKQYAKGGFGVRVEVSNFETAVIALRPSDSEKIIGKIWETTGLPSDTGIQALENVSEIGVSQLSEHSEREDGTHGDVCT